MKYIFLLSATVVLLGCNQNLEEQSPPVINPVIKEVISEPADESTELNLGSGVVLDNFSQRQQIESPLTITGVAPRSFFFEGSFPVTIMTLEDDIIKAWYATGPWLDPVEGRADPMDLRAEDPIPFTTTIEFEAPDSPVDMGKLRFAKDMVADGMVPVYVETMILWP